MSISDVTDAADSITVLANGALEIREATTILRDGVADPGFARRYHRYVLHPGASLDGCDPRIVAVADAVWTADLIAAWREQAAAAPDV